MGGGIYYRDLAICLTMDVSGEILSNFQAADQPNATVVLANATGLVLPYESNGIFPVSFELHVPFALAGLVSGYKFFLSDSAASTFFTMFFQVCDATSGQIIQSGVQVGASANITGSSFDTGNHYLFIRGTMFGGPGTLQLQFAQSVADVDAITILKGAAIRLHYI
jgi:hypothetical protein